jgi:alpha-D-xyloside xylohydrolase
LFRIHGDRKNFTVGEKPDEFSAAFDIPNNGASCAPRGAGNEIWSFGPEIFEILKELVHLRVALKPYISKVMQEAHETGVPPMRPLWMEFPNDPLALEQEEVFMLGSDWLIAPVTEYKARSWKVYLPGDSSVIWRHQYLCADYHGGQVIETPTPLAAFPLFQRADDEASTALFTKHCPEISSQ